MWQSLVYKQKCHSIKQVRIKCLRVGRVSWKKSHRWNWTEERQEGRGDKKYRWEEEHCGSCHQEKIKTENVVNCITCVGWDWYHKAGISWHWWSGEKGCVQLRGKIQSMVPWRVNRTLQEVWRSEWWGFENTKLVYWTKHKVWPVSSILSRGK